MATDRCARAVFALGALLAAADVGLRAWQAHGLAARLDPEGLRWFDTARAHQFGVALGLIASAGLMAWGAGRLAQLAALAFLIGGALFCGDLYQAAFAADHETTGVAPSGGIATMIAWLLAAAGATRGRPRAGAGTQIRTGG